MSIFKYLKIFFHLTIAFCINQQSFYSSYGMNVVYSQEVKKSKAQIEADTNALENKKRENFTDKNLNEREEIFFKNDGDKLLLRDEDTFKRLRSISNCDSGNLTFRDLEDTTEEYYEVYGNQKEQEIIAQQKIVDKLSGNLTRTYSKVSLGSSARFASNISQLTKDEIDDQKKEVESLQLEKRQLQSDKALNDIQIESLIKDCKSKDSSAKVQGGNLIANCDQDTIQEVNKRLIDKRNLEKQIVEKSEEISKASRQFNNSTPNIGQGGALVGQQGQMISDLGVADAQMSQVHVAAAQLEVEYRKLDALYNERTKIADELSKIADRRYQNIINSSKFNGIHDLYDLAVNGLENEQALERQQSNLEVMATASSAINYLKCTDISKNHSKSYPLFKSASATYIASQINSTNDFAQMTSCTQQEDWTPNEKRNEQVKIVERAVNLWRQFVTTTELKVATREKSLEMYRDAYAAALLEVTTKQSMTYAAEEQMKKAETWDDKAGTSVFIAILIVIIAINLFILSFASCPACFCCLVPPAKDFLDYALGLLSGHKADKSNAEQDMRKWKKELEKARVYSFMKCNYPGPTNDVDTLKQAPTTPEIFEYGIIYNLIDHSIPYAYARPIKDVSKYTYSWVNNIYTNGAIKLIDILVSDSWAQDDITPTAATTNPDQDQEEGLEGKLAVTRNTYNFTEFLKMNLGAWQLQSHNAAFLVDLRKSPVTIDHLHPEGEVKLTDVLVDVEKNIEDNGGALRSSIARNTFHDKEGKQIQKTGFPVPETRAVYLASVVKMFEENINYMNLNLTDARAYYGKMVQLLNDMKTELKLEVTGLVADKEETKPKEDGVCLKKGSDGVHVRDDNCNCRQTNTCSSFIYPDFKDIDIPELADAGTKIVDSANKLSNGDIKGANISSGDIAKNSSAIKRFIREKEKEINQNYKKAYGKDYDYTEESKPLLVQSRNKAFGEENTSTLNNNASKGIDNKKNRSAVRRFNQSTIKSKTDNKKLTSASKNKLTLITNIKVDNKKTENLNKDEVSEIALEEQVDIDDFDQFEKTFKEGEVVDGELVYSLFNPETDIRFDDLTDEEKENVQKQMTNNGGKIQIMKDGRLMDVFFDKKFYSKVNQIHRNIKNKLFDIISKSYRKAKRKKLIYSR